MVSREDVKGQMLHFVLLHGKVLWEGGLVFVVVEWKREDKGNLITLLSVEKGQGRSTGDRLDVVEGPVNHSEWETTAMEEGSHVSIIRMDAMLAKELGEWDESLQDVGGIVGQSEDKWTEDGIRGHGPGRGRKKCPRVGVEPPKVKINASDDNGTTSVGEFDNK
eukprot:g37479.t1